MRHNNPKAPSSTLRLFFALELDDEIKARIIHIIKTLQKRKEFSSIKWTPPEKLHITLRFIGQVEEEKVEACLRAVREKIIHNPRFNLPLGAVTAFPSHRPHIIAITTSLSEELAQLYQRVDSALVEAGFEPENRGYLPHITLGRATFITPQMEKKLAQAGMALAASTLEPSVQPIQLVKSVTLFRSDMGERGMVYSVVERVGF